MPSIHIGSHVICKGYDGIVVAVVPALCNPIRELRRRLGRVERVTIAHRNGEVPLRDHETYVVMAEHRGKVEYKWPKRSEMRLRDE